MPARTVEPEWLDSLPPDDLRARRARRDLARLNWIMGNAGFVREAVQGRLREGGCMADLGAGDGHFTARVAGLLRPAPRHVHVFLVDRAGSLSAAAAERFRRLGWRAEAVRADVIDWLAQEAPRLQVVVANLFLHHFPDPELTRLLALAADRTACLVACEPRRAGLALAASRLVRLAGCSALTAHDAVASVRAGFRGRELSRAWPAAGWRLEEGAAGAFSHRFVAQRDEAA